jgi:predicted DNA-binding transcriptional regulator AlpA
MAKITPTAPAKELLTASEAGAVFGVSERTFHGLRHRGVVPAPIVLGPRLLRWSRAELEAAVAKLPRAAAPAAEPAQLLRGKVEALKAGRAA